MGRVGDIYQVPSGTYGSPNTTISSTAYNANVNDVAADLNFPRPIVAGGTNATNDTMARTNLKTERSAQAITDFNTTSYEFGSFTSATSVANSPVAGHAFTGIVYGTDANNLTVEARDLNDTTVPGRIYVREKKAGTWVNSGVWTVDQSGAFVLKAGDTMTGQLTVNSGIVSAQSSATGTYYFGSSGANFLAHNGTNYQFGGAGGLNLTGQLTVSSIVMSAQTPTTGAFHFGSSGSKFLSYDGTSFALSGGVLTVNSTVIATSSLVAQNTATQGTVYFGAQAQNKYIFFDGTTFAIAGPTMVTGNNSILYINPTSGYPALNFMINGTPQTFINDNGGSINVNSNMAGSAGMYIVHGGNAWTAISDARLPYKRNARDITSELPSLDTFRLYENEVNGSLELFAKAQEVAELFPHVVVKGDDDPNYVPDGPGDPRAWGMSYDRLGAVALAYIRQQEQRIAALMARIEALEASDG